jgi:hypothetical protein
VDLFEPGSGSQVHDINGGILPSGLFWTVDFAQASVRISHDGERAKVRVRDLCGIDTFQIFGPWDTPATIDYSVELEAIGDAMEVGSGTEVPPTDPAAFLGEFFPAAAQGHYTGREIGFSFESGTVTADDTFAELGFERNGVFLED